MEFPFNINSIFPDVISVVDCHLCPESLTADIQLFNSNGEDGSRSTFGNIRGRKKLSELQQLLIEVIDEMGKSSAKAQNLQKSITSGIKLQHSNQRLYFVIDSKSNRELGAVIGMLKVGKKRLFVLDERGAHNEMDPFCILDFYVHESRQRQGYGHFLFEHMLKAEGVFPHHLAIDRPSSKFLAFIEKYYGLKSTIPQSNKYVIFQGFFDGKKGIQKKTDEEKCCGDVIHQMKMEALKEVPVSLNITKLKGRELGASAEKLLHWTDSSAASENFQSTSDPLLLNQQCTSSKITPPQPHCILKESISLHKSCKRDVNDLEEENWNTTIKHEISHRSCGPNLSGCSSTSTQSENFPMKWQSSSWKVLGVPPPQYSKSFSKKEDSLKNKFW